MIFNLCIYGTINKDEGTMKIHYYNNKLQNYCTKELVLNSSDYQFNLGDSDLKGLNSFTENNDVVIIEYYSTDNKKLFADKVILTKETCQRFDIDVDSTDDVGDLPEASDKSDFIISENVIKTTSNKVTENSTSIYSYFEVINEDLDKVVYSTNENFSFIPALSNKYKILQRGVNKLSNEISEKEYEFNAIVSAATITRSNKCKGINDSIKVLFMAYEGDTPNISIIKNDDVVETGTMASEGNNLFSYNYIFPSEGYFCFRVDYKDESFLLDFKVLQSDFKIYFIEENFKNNLNIDYNLYYINDLDTVIDTGTLNFIENGLYSSNLLSVDYGDYMFEIQGEYYVSSFEECSSSSSDGTNIKNSSLEEEIYWIFPNNLGD